MAPRHDPSGTCYARRTRRRSCGRNRGSRARLRGAPLLRDRAPSVARLNLEDAVDRPVDALAGRAKTAARTTSPVATTLREVSWEGPQLGGLQLGGAAVPLSAPRLPQCGPSRALCS